MGALAKEVLLCASSTIQLHDLATGGLLSTLKTAHDGTATERPRRLVDYVEARDGVSGAIVSAGGPGKGALSVWSFSKVRRGARGLV